MKKEFMLKGLNCPNCAAKIETAAGTLSGVSSASCNAMTSTLVLEVESAFSGTINGDVERIVYTYEPDVEVVAGGTVRPGGRRDDDEGEGRKQIVQFVIGALLFGAASVLRHESAAVYLYLASYAVLGWKVLYRAVRNLFKRQFFDENFLMGVATAGAFIVGEYAESVAVMLFYLVGEYFQDMAVRRSRKSISDLMDIRPDYANIKTEAGLERISPETVQVGDVIVVKPGEKIPLDGVVTDGKSALDTSALTGESAPRAVEPGDTVLSGCVNQCGVLTVEVTKIFGESTAAKIIDLVENAAGRKAPTENFITSFSRYYTPAVVGLAVLLAVIPPLAYGGGWSEWVHRALVFLVISCPCALVISIPLGFFGGIGCASKNGVLVKGGNYLEALGNLDIVVFDKTGTLTKGVFEVTDMRPAEGTAGEDLLEYAAHAEAFSNHPIAMSILKAYGSGIDKDRLSDYQEIPGHGVSVSFSGKKLLAGNARLMRGENIGFDEAPDTGTKIYVAVDGAYAGCIVISDQIKPDSRAAVAELKKRGVRKTVMLTGDDVRVAESVAETLSIDETRARLLPGQKVEIVEALETQKRPGGKLAFVGDGVNDAPVLARADVGVAMGGLGSDAAIEAADVVLMTDEPMKLAEAVDIAQTTKRIVRQNIVFALGIKGVFLILGAMGVSGMWEAVFADVGTALLAVLNSLRVLKAK